MPSKEATVLHQTFKILALGAFFAGAPLFAQPSLSGATGKVFQCDDAIESFSEFSLISSSECLGVQEEPIGERFTFSEPAGIVIEECNDPAGMMASFVLEEDSPLFSQPRDLVAEGKKIKGCRGRTLHPQTP